MNNDNLVNMLKKYKKINFQSDENATARLSYLTQFKVHDARMLFKIRSQRAPTIQMNFPSDKVFADNLWMCKACNSHRDTQSHVIQCESYGKYRERLNLENDGAHVKYFQTVINLRTN